MESTHLPIDVSEPVYVNPIARWDVYHRLQELSIPCSCGMGQPLQVCITTTQDAIQLWSVVQQVTASRGDRLAWLERCWQH